MAHFIRIFHIIPDSDKLIEIIKILELKFEEIDFNSSPDKLLKFVYENDFYQFNTEIIISIIKKFGDFNQVTFDNSNYFAIRNSNSKNLIEKVNTDLNEYIEKIYLKIDSNVMEDEESLIVLLNNTELKIENKNAIIEKTNTKIQDLSLIDNIDLIPILLINNNVSPNWRNLLIAYHNAEDKILDPTITFINNLDNAKELSKEKMPDTKVDEKNLFSGLCKDLIENTNIENEAYSFLTNSSPWWYSDLNIKDLGEEKTRSLIKNNVINPNVASFELLRKTFEGLNIELLEKHKKTFIRLISDITFNLEDIELILKSTVLKSQEKNQFLNAVKNEIITSNFEILKSISKLLLAESDFKIDELILREVLLNNQISNIDRIMIFTREEAISEMKFIDEFLISLGDNYKKITNRNKKAKIENNSYNIDLLNVLKRKKYISSFSTSILFGLRVYHRRQ